MIASVSKKQNKNQAKKSLGKGKVTKQDLANSRPPSCTTSCGDVTRPHKRHTGAQGPPAAPPPHAPARRNYYILIAVLTGSVRPGSSSSCCSRRLSYGVSQPRSPIGEKLIEI